MSVGRNAAKLPLNPIFTLSVSQHGVPPFFAYFLSFADAMPQRSSLPLQYVPRGVKVRNPDLVDSPRGDAFHSRHRNQL